MNYWFKYICKDKKGFCAESTLNTKTAGPRSKTCYLEDHKIQKKQIFPKETRNDCQWKWFNCYPEDIVLNEEQNFNKLSDMAVSPFTLHRDEHA